VRVRIIDEGSGMPPEVMARLGEPFLTTRAQGTGLGLYLSKRLVEGAKGSLRVERGPDRGTVVTVEFPVG
jgi:signal transduction histidine kinase